MSVKLREYDFTPDFCRLSWGSHRIKKVTFAPSRCVLTDQTVLVTGGSGFIGGHLVDRLDQANSVRLFDQVRPATNANNAKIIEGDIRDGTAVDAAVDGTDVVFHEAALVSVPESIDNPKRSHQINAAGTVNVLEAARKHDVRVVIASSAAIYGHPVTIPIPETHPVQPTSPYGLDKLAADYFSQLYHSLYGVETVVLRYFNVYGPGHSGGSYSGVIETFLDQARRDAPLTVHGSGEQTRDFVHVDDVVRATCAAGATDAVGCQINVGTGSGVTINELAEMVQSLTDTDSTIVHTDPRTGDIARSRADISRAETRLGYEPSIDIETGLTRMIASE